MGATAVLPPRGATRGGVTRPGSAFPEIDCLRDRLPQETLAAAASRALEVGVGLDRVLIAAGLIDEDSYIAALAHWLGLPCETFEHVTRKSCPLDDRDLMMAARTGLLPLIIDGAKVLVLAPRSVREFLEYADQHRNVRFRLTSATRLNRFISRCGAVALGFHAADALQVANPQLSAASRNPSQTCALAAAATFAVGAVVAFPYPAIHAFGAALAGVFLCWLALRIFSSCLRPTRVSSTRIPDRELPLYTIIVALYREAAAVEELVASLRAIDYPPEKLDIKLAVEADDHETLDALWRLRLAAPFEAVIVPQYGPRTKPKALNAGLAFARGTFTVIFDAEDRPEPYQLRRALEVFRLESNDDVACVQASLSIDNTDDNWLSALFTAEYAAHFDLFLPGLSVLRLRLPLPLGGSSNHFRTAVLREIGAWDPYNVTEDADVGLRLARCGFRSAMIHSTTYEEAPARPALWLRQRTRWFKGWLQTWGVHMRAPVRLWRELGACGFLAFQLVVGGNVVAALVHPLFLAWFIYKFAQGRGFAIGDDADGIVLNAVYGAALAAGYLVSIMLGLLGLARRGSLRSAWSLALVMLHWLLLSVAAWRALFYLACDPYGWEKTTHGLGKSSRRARMNSSATLAALFQREAHAHTAIPLAKVPPEELQQDPLRTDRVPPPRTRRAAA